MDTNGVDTDELLAAENRALRARVAELEGQNAELKGQIGALSEKVITLSKLLFGDSTEKKAKKTLTLPVGESTSEKRPRGQQRGSKGHGRRDYSNLETEEVIHDVPAEEQVCPECEAPYERFGEETSDQIDWRVNIVRIVHRRPTYRKTCTCSVQGILVAPSVPKVIRKGLFTSLFLARLLVEKYVYGRPIERIVAALMGNGFDVAKGTLIGTLQPLAELLSPLDEAIRLHNGKEGHLHIDETSWKVFEEIEGKSNSRWWLWTFVGQDTVVFIIDPTRSTSVLTRHLGINLEQGALEAGRHLLVSSDFYTTYQSLAKVDGVDPLYCWAHIRRYFLRAGEANKELTAWTGAWSERIGKLYLAHKAIRNAEIASDALVAAKAEFAAVMEVINITRHEESADETLHPGARKVLVTLENEWDGLLRHQDFTELDLDNNAAERALRNPVVLRKNCYGSGSVWAATLAAQVWTITATAKLAGCNPLTYLTSYLDVCARGGGEAPSGKELEAFFVWKAECDTSAWKPVAPGPGT